jgi:hypothetical protein
MTPSGSDCHLLEDGLPTGELHYLLRPARAVARLAESLTGDAAAVGRGLGLAWNDPVLLHMKLREWSWGVGAELIRWARLPPQHPFAERYQGRGEGESEEGRLACGCWNNPHPDPTHEPLSQVIGNQRNDPKRFKGTIRGDFVVDSLPYTARGRETPDAPAPSPPSCGGEGTGRSGCLACQRNNASVRFSISSGVPLAATG